MNLECFRCLWKFLFQLKYLHFWWFWKVNYSNWSKEWRLGWLV